MTYSGARSSSLEALPTAAGADASCEETTPAFSRHDLTGHIFSCLLEIAFADARQNGTSIEDALGIASDDIDTIAAMWRPAMVPLLKQRQRQANVSFDEEEEQLLDLFARFRTDDRRETIWLASALTRRCMSPNHLWQDLGLNSRLELGQLMLEFFPALAARNVLNMKWKKFFYRSLCEMEGFTLCASPSCQQCNDYSDCFGEETGLGRLHQKNAGQ
jgi:nitrogen fixation protein NifQ